MNTDRGEAFKARIQDHVDRYRRTDGEDGGSMGPGSKVLLLTTTGRKSGRQHTVPLTYHEDAGTPVIIASNGGLEQPPQWFRNLSANPKVRLKVFADEYDAQATVVPSDDRARIWPDLVERYPGYARYQENMEREIQLVRLNRAS